MPTLTQCPRTLVPGSAIGVAAVLAAAIVAVVVTVRPAYAGTPACAPAALAGCKASEVPEQTKVWLHDRPLNSRDTLVWKWRRGQASTVADFGDPSHAHGYAMCIYDADGALIFHASVPSGGSWQTESAGFKYRNGRATPEGLTKVILKAGSDASASVIVKGRGDRLQLPPLPLTPPLTFQLQEETGPCWGATYESSGVRLNQGGIFRAAASH